MAQLSESTRFQRRFAYKSFQTTHGVLRYIDDGPRSQTAIVFIHGNPTWSYLYRHLLEKYRKKHRVIAVDLIGYGLSDKPNDPEAYQVTTQVSNVALLLASLNLSDLVFVGQDWGGPICTLLASRFKATTKGIVLMNTYLPGLILINQPGRHFLKGTTAKFLSIRLDLFRKVAFTFGFSTRPSRAIRAAYNYPHRKPEQRLAVWILPTQIPSKKPTQEQLDIQQTIDRYLTESSCPKLLLVSDHDPIFRVKKFLSAASEIPNATSAVIPHAGHFLQEENPQAIIDQMDRWLKKI